MWLAVDGSISKNRGDMVRVICSGHSTSFAPSHDFNPNNDKILHAINVNISESYFGDEQHRSCSR